MEFDWGFYINHEDFLNTLYENVYLNYDNKEKYVINKSMFDILGQFIMDSHYDKIKRQNEEDKNIQSHRKRKRKFSINTNFDSNIIFNDSNFFSRILIELKTYINSSSKNIDPVSDNYLSITTSVTSYLNDNEHYSNNKSKNAINKNSNMLHDLNLQANVDKCAADPALFSQNINFDDHQNNKAARLILNLPKIGSIFINECSKHKAEKDLYLPLIKTIIYEDNYLDISDIVNQYITVSNMDLPFFRTIVQIENNFNVISIGKFLFPQNCSFLISDISSIHILVDVGFKYDCIVIDPPWTCKSVKRKKIYGTLQYSDLLELPLSDLCNDNALVFVWVTNKESHQNFIMDKLFKKYNISLLAKWFWLKVTKYMEPVVDFNQSNNKKPYETLFVGRYKINHSTNNSQDLKIPEIKFNEFAECNSLSMLNVDNCFSKSNIDSSHINIDNNFPMNNRDVPDKFVIVSIPCIIHSHKPPLDDIIKKYVLTENASKLELFARCLKPGWTSWGNEVLALQHEQYFQTCKL